MSKSGANPLFLTAFTLTITLTSIWIRPVHAQQVSTTISTGAIVIDVIRPHPNFNCSSTGTGDRSMGSVTFTVDSADTYTFDFSDTGIDAVWLSGGGAGYSLGGGCIKSDRSAINPNPAQLTVASAGSYTLWITSTTASDSIDVDMDSLGGGIITVGGSALAAVLANPFNNMWIPDDDRINVETGAPVIIYCQDKEDGGGYIIYEYQDASDGLSQVALVIPDADMPATPAEGYILVATTTERGGVDVYYGADEMWRVEANIGRGEGKKYVFEWDGSCLPIFDKVDTEEGFAGIGSTGPTIPQVPPALADLPNIGLTSSVDVTGLPGYVITNLSPMFLRSGPGAEFVPVALIGGGIPLEAVARSENDVWYQVRTKDGDFIGWLRARNLILRGDLSALPVIPFDSPDFATNVAPPTLVTSLNQTIYPFPNMEGSSTCEAAPGEFVITGINRFDTWYQILVTCTSGTQIEGWIPADQGLLRNPSRNFLPIIDVSATTTVETTDGTSTTLVTATTQLVYPAPSMDASTRCEVAPGTHTILDTDASGDFVQVAVTCLNGAQVTGWIPVSAGQ